MPAILFRSQWASFQICRISGCACVGNAGNVLPTPRVSEHDMHHGRCVTHVPGCMPGSLTWSRRRGKRSRYSRRMHNPQLSVSGKGPCAIRRCEPSVLLVWCIGYKSSKMHGNHNSESGSQSNPGNGRVMQMVDNNNDIVCRKSTQLNSTKKCVYCYH